MSEPHSRSTPGDWTPSSAYGSRSRTRVGPNPCRESAAVTLSELKGSVVILDFWATWCGPCVASLPHLNKIYTDLQKDGLKVYALNQREDKQKVADFITNKNLTIPVLLDKEGNVAKQYLVTGIPQTVVIGKDGIVKKVLIGTGPDSEEMLRKAVDGALRK